jgi:membrane protease subunit HflK
MAAGAGAPVEEKEAGVRALEQALKISFGFLKLTMAALIVLYLLSGFFVVGPNEVKMRLTFGRPEYEAGKIVVMDSQTGWHFKWPWQRVLRVETTEKQLKLEKAFWYREAGRMPGQPEEEAPPPGEPLTGLDPVTDHYVITGDANILHLKMTAKYRTLPELAPDYVFRMANPDEFLRVTLHDATIRVVAGMEVDDILTRRREEVIRAIVRESNARLKSFEARAGHGTGVVLTGLTLDAVAVPKTVKPSFDQADAARNDYYVRKRDAEARRQEIIRKAEGEAKALESEAEAEKSRLVSAAQADAKRVGELASLYNAHPETFRQRYYQEKIQQVLEKAKQVWVLHSSPEGGQRRLWLYTGPIPPKLRREASPHPGQSK